VGTLASQAKIGVWVQAVEPLAVLGWVRYGVRGITPGKNLRGISYAKSWNLVHFGRKMVRYAVNIAYTANYYILTIETPLPRVPREMTPDA